MCIDKADIHREVEASERRMEAKIESSHMGIAKTVSQWGAEVRDLREQFKAHAEREEEDRAKLHSVLEKLAKLDIEAANEIVTGYKGIISIRNLTTGIASVIVAFGVIGAMVISVIKSVR